MALTRARGRSPASPASPSSRLSPNRVLAVASFGAVLAFLDATVVNVAFPSIRESFPAATIGALSWVLNAYNIVFAAFLIIFGRVADLLGRRRLLSAGTIVFTLASLWCAAAGSLEVLVLARVVQAFGAAMLVPASLAVVVEAFPRERRSHAVGLWGASAAVAAGLGPPIGGALIELGGWRWVFLVNLPLGLVAVVLNRSSLVESRSPAARRLPDVLGAVLLALALGLLTLGIVQGNDWGWTSGRVIGAFAGAVGLGTGFVMSSRRHPSPLLDVDVLRIRPFAIGNAVTFVAGMGFYAYLLTNILWLQYVWGYGVLTAGLALVPSALVAAVTAASLGEVAQRRGYRGIVVLAAVIWSCAYLWYAEVVTVEPAFLAHWLPGQILSGLGAGATLPLFGSAALSAVPQGRYATSSAVISAARQIGGVLGISVLVLIIGTPTPATAVDALRDGWLFSAGCFAVAALVALALRQAPAATSVEGVDLTGAAVKVEIPAGSESGGTQPLAPHVPHSYLDELPDVLRRELEARGRAVRLAAGEWLFREGDRAESMYLLSSGRLEVHQNESLIRELGAGSVLGELALLSGDGVRSASARARRDSTLVEVSRSDFLAALEQDAEAPMVVAGALARALQTPSRRTDQPSSQPCVVAVVGLHPESPVREVADALTEHLRTTLRVMRSESLSAEGLMRAERDHDRLVLTAHAEPGAPEGQPAGWWEACLRQADRVLLVARTDDQPTPGWEHDLAVRPDLVLVGSAPTAEALERWCVSLAPDRVVVSAADALRPALRSLAAALGGRAVGLVLAGGGARAMSHLGVLHEFEAAGVHVDRIAGCSLGAIVAGAYATGMTAAEVEEACYTEFVRRRLGATTRIEALPRGFRCTSTDLLGRVPFVHRSGPLWQAVAASARLPVLFPPMRLDGRLLVDGGVLDNLPVGLLTERDEGPVVAVNIGVGGTPRGPGQGGPTTQHGLDGTPSVPTTPRPLRVPGLGETLMRTMLIGSGGAVERARAAGAYIISPPTLGVGLMEFHQMDRMIESGRHAARALLEATGGDLTVAATGGAPGLSAG